MTCAKRRVLCKIELADGRSIVGENACLNPQQLCPRQDLPTGVGYELCKDVCKQVGHAEEVAVSLLREGDRPTKATITGHNYVCDNCKSILRSVGITEVEVVFNA